MHVLIDIGVLMLMVNLLNLLLHFTSLHILAHDYLLVISLLSLVRANSCFCMSWHNG
jgi:hypothetical protein